MRSTVAAIAIAAAMNAPALAQLRAPELPTLMLAGEGIVKLNCLAMSPMDAGCLALFHHSPAFSSLAPQVEMECVVSFRLTWCSRWFERYSGSGNMSTEELVIRGRYLGWLFEHLRAACSSRRTLGCDAVSTALR